MNDPGNRYAPAEHKYVEAILRGKRQEALTVVLDAFREHGDVIDIYVHVLQPSMYEVGRRWETNRITVAEEHMATAITQYVLAQLYSELEPSDQNRGRAVITGVQGELHQVGANIVADAFEADGWNVQFLGTNTPPEAVLEAVEQHEATLFGVSATMVFNIDAVASLVEEVRRRWGGAGPKVLLGGAAFRTAPRMVDELDVSGWAGDVRTALSMARKCQEA